MKISIPKGWRRERLDRVATVQTGIAKNSSAAGGVECPYLRVANVQDGYLNLEVVKNIRVPTEKIERYALQCGDVLMTEGGDFDKLGRGAVWRGEIDCCLHQNHVFAVRAGDWITSDFLSSLTGSHYGKRYFQGCSKQSTNLASINSSQLKAFPVILPPLPEQKAIADTLSTWDRAIEKLDRLIAAKEKRFEGLVQAFISKPVSSNSWKQVPFGSFLKESRCIGSSGDSAQKLTIKLYGRGVVAKSDKRKGSSNTRYYVRKSGQFIFSKLDFLNGAFGIVPKALDGFESTLDLPAFDINREVDPHWLLYFMTRPEYYTRQVGLSKGQRVARRVSPKEFLSSKISLPSLEEQHEIAGMLDSAQREINLLKQQADATRRQKRGLMQKLLTGEWRVRGVEGHGVDMDAQGQDMEPHGQLMGDMVSHGRDMEVADGT